MTNKKNMEYLEAAKIGSEYRVKQALNNVGCAIAGLGGLGYSALDLAQDGDAWKYVAGLGVMVGAGVANLALTKLNKKKERRALNNLIEFEVTNPEMIARA